MKQTIILLTGILVFSLSSLVSQGANSSVNFESINQSSLYVQEEDPDLEIEDWMIDSKLWNNENSIKVLPVSDEELKIEDWMIQSNIW